MRAVLVFFQKGIEGRCFPTFGDANGKRITKINYKKIPKILSLVAIFELEMHQNAFAAVTLYQTPSLTMEGRKGGKIEGKIGKKKMGEAMGD